MRAVKRYLSFYLEHMRLEEAVILPAAQRVLDEQDWAELDAAFATNCDPLTGKYPPRRHLRPYMGSGNLLRKNAISDG